MRPPVVIVGGGHAAAQVVESLGREGYTDPVTLLAAEPVLPYQRPPLSKHYMRGDLDPERLLIRPRSFYHSHRVDVRLNTRVVGIDRDKRCVTTAAGQHVGYSKLVLALGARVREIQVAGADLDGVVYLRSLADADRIRTLLSRIDSVVVIGGGFIGLEFAAVARTMGKSVVVLEAQERLMARVVAPFVSTYFSQLHQRQGVEVVLSAQVAAILGAAGKVTGVETADGRRFKAGLVLVGIGVLPNVELAAAAGLTCDNGIVVDSHCCTGDADIFAAGDCCNHPNRFAGGRARLESVQNAADQGRVVAININGRAADYDVVPWFWSDQYQVKTQMVGINRGFDQMVVRGTPDADKFSVLYFNDGRLLAIDSINSPADHMAGRKLLAGRCQLTTEQAADCSFKLISALH